MEDPELTKRWLGTILTETQRLERLIKDLLDISMMEADQVELTTTECDLKALVEHTVQVLTPRAEKQDIKIHLELPDEAPEWTLDHDRISQVLLNLVDNALKYSEKSTNVHVKLYFSAEQATIEVADEGAGIKETELPKIFDRFYRIEESRATRFGGRGLGLSIAKHLMEAHGGDLLVSSVFGEGSKFSMTIPRQSDWDGDDDL